MSRHSKGARLEKKCRDDLKKLGWLPEYKVWSKFAGKDFWNVFDVIAIKKGEVLTIQVKANNPRKKEVEIKLNRIKNHIPASWQLQIWVWKDYAKDWEIHKLEL